MRKIHEESPWILVFGLEIASGVKQKFLEFPGVCETVLSGIFIGKVTNLKISGFFFKKVHPQPPRFKFFSGIAYYIPNQ